MGIAGFEVETSVDEPGGAAHEFLERGPLAPLSTLHQGFFRLGHSFHPANKTPMGDAVRALACNFRARAPSEGFAATSLGARALKLHTIPLTLPTPSSHPSGEPCHENLAAMGLRRRWRRRPACAGRRTGKRARHLQL